MQDGQLRPSPPLAPAWLTLALTPTLTLALTPTLALALTPTLALALTLAATPWV